MKIVFYGTPEFAVPSLALLLEHKVDVAAVVTASDKPSGRGLKLSASPVKVFAEKMGIPVLQPNDLTDPVFLAALKNISPDLQIVVAFRKMPEEVWALPTLGTFNLHGSILPQYRGAAPINHAVINGEKETGVTTFFLEKKIDTGKILFTEKIELNTEESAGEVHDRLMKVGAQLVLKTLRAIESEGVQPISQEFLVAQAKILNKAPKLNKEFCRIDWRKAGTEIHNFIRGLSPNPGAFTLLENKSAEKLNFKIFKSKFTKDETRMTPGSIDTDSKTFLRISCSDGFISLLEVQLEGKKRMNIAELLRGSSIDPTWKVF